MKGAVLHVLTTTAGAVGGMQLFVGTMVAADLAQGRDAFLLVPEGEAREGLAAALGLPRERVLSYAVPPLTWAEMHASGAVSEATWLERVALEHGATEVWLHGLGHFLGTRQIEALRRRGVRVPFFFHQPAVLCQTRALWQENVGRCDGVVIAAKCARCVLVVDDHWPRPLARAYVATPLARWRTRIPRLRTALGRVAHAESLRVARLAALAACDEIIVPAAWARAMLVANGLDARKIRIVRHGHPGPSRELALRTPAPGARLRLGLLGRLEREKGVHDLVEAARLLAQGGVAVDVEIAGFALDAAYLAALRARSAPNTRFLPPLHGEARSQWLASLDVLVVPSHLAETGPLVIMEAWSQGTLVLGAAHSGIGEQLADQGMSEFSFPEGDPEALAALVRSIGARRWERPLRVSLRGIDAFSAEIRGADFWDV